MEITYKRDMKRRGKFTLTSVDKLQEKLKRAGGGSDSRLDFKKRQQKPITQVRA